MDCRPDFSALRSTFAKESWKALPTFCAVVTRLSKAAFASSRYRSIGVTSMPAAAACPMACDTMESRLPSADCKAGPMPVTTCFTTPPAAVIMGPAMVGSADATDCATVGSSCTMVAPILPMRGATFCTTASTESRSCCVSPDMSASSSPRPSTQLSQAAFAIVTEPWIVCMASSAVSPAMPMCCCTTWMDFTMLAKLRSPS